MIIYLCEVKNKPTGQLQSHDCAGVRGLQWEFSAPVFSQLGVKVECALSLLGEVSDILPPLTLLPSLQTVGRMYLQLPAAIHTDRKLVICCTVPDISKSHAADEDESFPPPSSLLCFSLAQNNKHVFVLFCSVECFVHMNKVWWHRCFTRRTVVGRLKMTCLIHLLI